MLTNREQETLNTYNKIARDWAKTLTEDYWKKERFRFSKLLSTGKILDVGCGNGVHSKWFSEHGYNLVGVDASRQLISLARQINPKGNFLIKSFYRLNFPEKSFDGFWTTLSLIHAPRNKISLPLAQIHQVMKPGAIGFIAIKEGLGERKLSWQNKKNTNRFFVYYTRKEFSKILNQSGFEILEKSKRPPAKRPQDGTFLTFFVKVL